MSTPNLSLPHLFPVNVSPTERWASLFAGGLLAGAGMASRKPLGWGLIGLGAVLAGRGATGRCPAYGAFGINFTGTEPLHIHRSVTVKRPRQEVYDFWRQLENLPRFMRHLEKVESLDERRSHWRARAPKGMATVEWDAELTDERPGERLAWHSLSDAQVENAGAVEFVDAPGGEGTEIHVDITYRPPGGPLARLFNPALAQMVKEDVRRCKSLLETGEVPTIEGQPTGD